MMASRSYTSRKGLVPCPFASLSYNSSHSAPVRVATQLGYCSLFCSLNCHGYISAALHGTV